LSLTSFFRQDFRQLRFGEKKFQDFDDWVHTLYNLFSALFAFLAVKILNPINPVNPVKKVICQFVPGTPGRWACILKGM